MFILFIFYRRAADPATRDSSAWTSGGIGWRSSNKGICNSCNSFFFFSAIKKNTDISWSISYSLLRIETDFFLKLGIQNVAGLKVRGGRRTRLLSLCWVKDYI